MSPGERYERYQIVEPIGRGAMGEVYRARDVVTQLEVALKIVFAGSDPEDQEVVAAERFGAELQKRLSSADKRVVRVNRYGDALGNLFVDMEFIDGQDLSALMTRGPMDPRFAAYVARELCQMLENLRAFTTTIGDRQFLGVIHGDLKPRNIRLDRKNGVRVLDFGIAKALSGTRKCTLNLFGSTAYCSPERLETQNMDARSDLWSVGVLLYQMVAGQLPFQDSNKERVERRIRSTQGPDPLPDSCPDPLRRIVLKMLARDPASRYATAAEANEDLARYQTGRPVLAEIIVPAPNVSESEATIRTVAAEAAGADDRTVRTASPPPPRIPGAAFKSMPLRRPSRLLMGCVAVLLVGVMGSVGFALSQWSFSNAATRLKDDIQTEQVANLSDAWTRYQNLNQRAHLPVLMWGARAALRKRLVTAADETISEYRNSDSPMVYEAQWIEARNDLSRALDLDPGNNDILGRLLLCEGHIDRIAAAGMHGVARQRKLNAAITKFNESAERIGNSPDPYLGLARIYVYDVNDVERAEDALNHAARNGHPLGHRETAQLADGYRRRGDRFLHESLGFGESPDQERDYLDKARQDYIHAEDLYRQAGLFGDSSRNELLAIQAKQKVDTILAQLHASDPQRSQ